MDANAGTMRQMTLGEYRVGISFNPGGHEAVNEIKRRAADLIDYIKALPSKGVNESEATVGEVERLKALAITDVENAAMWAVKAATKPAR